ncbi:hypothetical protein HanRHA438_Chr12g0535521 [Helianthus annuus]|nr:hypothetical protein HanRHA438_Chr12g0535521 [Helianthus annuus]
MVVRLIVRPSVEMRKDIDVMRFTIKHPPFTYYWRIVFGHYRSETVIDSPWRLLTTLWPVDFLIDLSPITPSFIPSLLSSIISRVTTSHKTRNPVRVYIVVVIVVVVKPFIPVSSVVVLWLTVVPITLISSTSITIFLFPNVVGVLRPKLLIIIPSSIIYVSPIQVTPIFIIIGSIIIITPIVRIFRMNAHVFRRLITGNTIRFVIGNFIP